MRFELKKIFSTPLLLYFLLICSFLNIYKIIDFYDYNCSFARDDIGNYQSAYWKLYDKYSGTLNADKIKEIILYVNEHEQDIINSSFDKETDYDKYLTGSYFLDYQIIKIHYYLPIKYSYEYKRYSDQVCERAMSNIDFYSEFNNTYEILKNQQIVNLYANRYISSLYYTEAFEDFFSYEFSILMISFLLIFGISPIFVNEKTTGMQDLIYSCSKGRGYIFVSKVIAVICYIIFIFIWFVGSDLICFCTLYKVDGASNPLYSIEAFIDTPFGGSIGQFLIVFLIYRLLGILVLGMVIMLISMIFSKPLFTTIVSLCTTLFFLFSGSFGQERLSMISPIKLIRASDLFYDYAAMNFFGYPVPLFIMYPICAVTLIGILLGIGAFIYIKKSIALTRKNKKRRCCNNVIVRTT